MGLAAPKTISGIRKADPRARFCPKDQALPQDITLSLEQAVMEILARLSITEGSNRTHMNQPKHSHPRLARRRTPLCISPPFHRDTRHR